MAYTPDNIKNLEPNQIFVFGSNYAGRHGRGAALTALRKFGARAGQGTGLMGQSYGIATKDKNLNVLPVSKIGIQINKFLKFAMEHEEFEFLVTEVGCGLAGYKPRDIAPFFAGAPDNVVLPKSFADIIYMDIIGDMNEAFLSG